MSQIQGQHPHPRIHPLPRPAEPRGLRRGVSLLPSLFTLANLFCGWACVIYAMRGDLTTAAPFIGIAIVLDMLDGRIARMTGTTSEFGLQLDSLADLISFGMAPAILAFQWGLAPLGRLGWAVGFLFVTAAALRLARFNIQAHTDKRYFVGMPSPAAAAIPAATVFYFPDGMQTYPQALPALAVVLVPALLMVSTIRFRSFKSLDLGTKRSYRGLIALAALIAAVASRPHEVLLLMAYAYLASAFVGLAMSRLRSHQASEPQQKA
ncbi:MAG: CDP-diacylglycerol--serine O-phosphatidyltransferase [Acidobacteria bacterium]|nr:CDP-diacylglycerol--serine O-phosphatidyltransferase [Acidobacteriota bacterium]